MEDEFKYTKEIVDKVISDEGEDGFTLGHVIDKVENKGGIKRVAVGCSIERYLDGLLEINDLEYNFSEDIYKTKR